MKILHLLNEWYNRTLEQRIAYSIFAGGGMGQMALKGRMIRWLNRLPLSVSFILDVGSGDRKWRRYIPVHARYCGIDLPTASRIYPWRAPQHDIAADGQSLPFHDQTCDVVICVAVLEHVPAPQLVIAEIARVLKPGGVLLLVGPGDVCMAHGMPFHYYNLTADCYALLFEKHGMLIEEEFFPLKFWDSFVMLLYSYIVRHLGYNKNAWLKLLQAFVFIASLPVMPVVNLVAHVLDAFLPFDRRGYALYAARLKKEESSHRFSI